MAGQLKSMRQPKWQMATGFGWPLLEAALDDVTPWMPGAVHIRPQMWPLEGAVEGNAEAFALGKYV